MIKNLFRLTVLSYVWTRYKFVITSTLLLFAYFWLVGEVHKDFVEFIGLNNDTEHLGVSFLVKWLALMLGVLVYFALNRRRRGSSATDSRLTQTAPETSEDPFEAIRKKDKLKSAADFVVERKKR
ncbi:MAG: hypothetical protein ACPH96_02170 [Porticoccaceae bacterium]